MANPLFTNFARTTLQAGISNLTASPLAVSVATGTGVLFPSPGAGQYFPLVVVNSSGQKEIMYCTARATDTLTCTRAQEGTSQLTFNAGDICGCRFTQGSLADIALLGQAFGAAEGTIAAAATTDLSTVSAASVSITGTGGPITSFGAGASGTKKLCRPTAAFTITNGAAIICPGGADISTEANDLFWIESLGSGNWIIAMYQRTASAVSTLKAGTAAGNLVQLDAGAKLPAVDGSALTNLPLTTAATQAQMEAASLNTVYASPSNIKNSPFVAKAWGFITNNGVAVLAQSAGVTSVSRTGVGSITVTLSTPMSSSQYCPISSATGGGNTAGSSALTTTTFVITSRNGANTQVDVDCYFVVYGDQ